MGRPPLIIDEKLLAAAREVFVKSGPAGSTREIARNLGISESAIFKRYATKAELFFAAMQPPRPDIEAILGAADGVDTAERQYLAISLEILVYFRVAIPIMLPLMTHPEIGLDELLKHYGRNPPLELTDALAGWVGRNTATPEPMAAAAFMVAALHTIAQYEIMGIHGGALPPEALEAMIMSHWKGLEPQH